MQERLWNRNYCRVMAANFALFFAFYLLTPLLPLYLVERFDATKDVVGLVLSGYTLTALLARPFSGFLVDTFPRKRVLMVCFFLFFICFGGYLGASSLLLFTIVRTLHGAPFGALTVANSTVAIDVLPSSRRNEGIGYYGLSNNLAMAIAPTVAIYIYRLTDNFELLFWLALLIAGAGMLTDAGVKLERPKGGAGEAAAGVAAARLGGLLRWDRFFLLRGWLLAVNMIFFGFCFGVVSNYLAIYSKDVMGITGGTGTWFLLLAGGLMASRLQGARALREGRLVENAAEGIALSCVAYLLFVACPNVFGYYASALLLGFGNGHMWPAFLNMIISMARHNERGTANSTLLISWDVGIGLGVLAGGVVSEALSYEAAFWTVAASQFIGAVLFFAFTRQSFERNRI
ncbi:MAG: MFS transporter [Bacteroidaceae bacterium]|nr:MFS transporter [Bacteroidaceae bacterium]